MEAGSRPEEIESAQADLWIAVGEGEEPPTDLDLLADSLPAADRTPSLGQLAEMVSQAPELRVLALRHRMEQVAVEAARAGRLPTIKFVSGYTLDQDASPCVDAGGDTAANVGLDQHSTSTFGIRDSGTVDMGYHFEGGWVLSITDAQVTEGAASTTTNMRFTVMPSIM